MSVGFADWLAITRVIARYARFADQRRFTEMAGLFVPDGRMLMFRPRAEEPAESPQGQEELIAAFSALAAFTVTTHALSPSDVEIGGGTARAHTTCMSHHISETGEGRVRFTLADRYDDTLVRLDGRWLFQERRKYTDWTEQAALRRSLPVAAIVDASLLERLLEDAEELADIRAVDEAWDETERLSETPIPWDDVKRDLGLTS